MNTRKCMVKAVLVNAWFVTVNLTMNRKFCHMLKFTTKKNLGNVASVGKGMKNQVHQRSVTI
jgi:hypothetical protein